MKTLVVISDTHGNLTFSSEFERVLSECDNIIHLGDTSLDSIKLRDRFGDKIISINGNCDFHRLGEEEKVLEIEGVKFFLTHGDRYHVKQSLTPLALKAKELGCSVALYGHTHTESYEEIEGIKLLNPGTLSRFSHKSYAFLVINGDKLTHKLVSLS